MNTSAKVVYQSLLDAGFDVKPGVQTSDDSTLFKIGSSNDLAVDVFPNDDLVLFLKKGDVRYYHEYRLGDMPEIIVTIRKILTEATPCEPPA